MNTANNTVSTVSASSNTTDGLSKMLKSDLIDLVKQLRGERNVLEHRVESLQCHMDELAAEFAKFKEAQIVAQVDAVFASKPAPAPVADSTVKQSQKREAPTLVSATMQWNTAHTAFRFIEKRYGNGKVVDLSKNVWTKASGNQAEYAKKSVGAATLIEVVLK
jgi:hypothetical protein